MGLLRSRRLQLKLRLKDVAVAADLSVPTISLAERGLQNLGAEARGRVSVALGLDEKLVKFVLDTSRRQ